MTWSILARDPSGQFGAAIASQALAVGGHCIFGAGLRGMVATQAFTNPLYGVDGLALLNQGQTADALVAQIVTPDPGASVRQFHAIDAQGLTAAHTGPDCSSWAGHVSGDAVSIAGNLLSGPEVLTETLRAYREAATRPFAERLLAAMDAGQATGGDRRGQRAAGMRIWDREAYPILDFRVDAHETPLDEMRRLLGLAQDRYIPASQLYATRDNPAGCYDKAALEVHIARYHAERAKP